MYLIFYSPCQIICLVSSEFRCLWLIAGNRYLQCDGLRDVDTLDENGGLTVALSQFAANIW